MSARLTDSQSCLSSNRLDGDTPRPVNRKEVMTVDKTETTEYDAWLVRKTKEFARIGRKYGNSVQLVALDVLLATTPDTDEVDVSFRKRRK